MMKRLSYTWKQQKQGEQGVKLKTRKRTIGKNRSILTKSLVRSPEIMMRRAEASVTSPDDESECVISPPMKTKKLHERDNISLGMSIEWGVGDSILNAIDDFPPNIFDSNSPATSKNPLTKVDTNAPTTSNCLFTKVLSTSANLQVPSPGTLQRKVNETKGNGEHVKKVNKNTSLNLQDPVCMAKDKEGENAVNGGEHMEEKSMENEAEAMVTSVTESVKEISMKDNGESVKDVNVEADQENLKEVDMKDDDVFTEVVVEKNCKSSSASCAASVGGSLSLSCWGLPENVLLTYKKHGIEDMFPWQQECLLTGKVLEGGNLVYSAPTSAGKTLVAEILMLKRVMETKKKALYILPFVSVSREKMYSLRELYEESNVKVGGFMGSESPPGGLNEVDVAVCTIEKANSLVNRLMEEKNIPSLCCIVVDELHMIGDPGRGYLLELLLTKIRFVASKMEGGSGSIENIQIIGMSATLPNLSMLAGWLSADLYFTDFRPVPLSEHIKVGVNLFDKNNNLVRKLEDFGMIRGDEDGVVPLCIHTIREGNAVLIFCPTKNWCEKLGETIASFFSSNAHLLLPSTFKKASQLTSDHSSIEDILDQLRNCPVGLDTVLEKMVKQRVAFHHAGLTYDERDIIEGAFRRGIVRVLVATSTLSSGVNLPARRVIIRSPMFYGRVLDSLVYKQMSGRAGRKGIDPVGESILISKPAQKKNALSLLQSDLKPVYSCLLDGSGSTKSMKRALLEVITAGVAVTPQDVACYEKMTYLHTCLEKLKELDFKGALGNTIEFLCENEFITLQQTDGETDSERGKRYYPTQLGTACLASSLSPDEALLVFAELRKARKSFVLENELHLIYQITPIYLQDQWADLDWYLYYNIWERLPAQYKYVGEIVGVEERFLAKAVRNSIQTKTKQQMDTLRIHRRFYTALVLQELVNEVPIPVISKRYKINKGMLQSLQNASATFAGMLTVFCAKLGWTCLELLLEQFQSRLTFGVSRELCNLVRISLLSGFKARFFYERGYESVSAIAFASQDDIASLLRESVPFESKRVNDKNLACNSRKANCRNIWLTGKEGLTEHEAAQLIIREAKKILKADAAALGLSIPTLVERSDDASPIACTLGQRKSSSGSRKKRSTNSVKGDKKIKRNSNSRSSLKTMNSINKQSANFIDSTSSGDISPVRRGFGEASSQFKENKENCIKMINKKKRKSPLNMSALKTSSLKTSLHAPPLKASLVKTSSLKDLLLKDSPLKTSPLKVSLLKTSPLKASPHEASALKASPLTASPLKASPLKASPLKASPLKASLLKASPVKASPVKAPPLDAPPFKLSPQNPLPLKNDNGKTTRKSSSLLFSDTEFDFEFIDTSPSALHHSKDTTVPTGDNVLIENQDGNCIFNENSSKQYVGTLLGSSESKLENANTKELIDVERNVVKLKTSTCDLDTGSGLKNCPQIDVIQAATCTQLINVSNDSMFLLAGSILEPVKELLPTTDIQHVFSEELFFSSFLSITDVINPPEYHRGEKISVQPLNLEHQFDEVLKQDLNTAGLGINTDRRNVDDDMCVQSTESDQNLEFEMLIGSQDLFKSSSVCDNLSDIAKNSFQNNSIGGNDSYADGFIIIDVTSDKDLFSTFCKEWSLKKRYSLCFACQNVQPKKNPIGRNIKSERSPPVKKMDYIYSTDEFAVVGLAVCWGEKDSYYINLEPDPKEHNNDLNDTALPPVVANELTISSRLNILKFVFLEQSNSRSIIASDMKYKLKLLFELFGSLLPSSTLLDPKVADWILSPSDKGKDLHALVRELLTEDFIDIVEACGSEVGRKDVADSPIKGRMRACVESVLVYNLMDVFEEKLKESNLYEPYIQVEMPAIRTMTIIEINGIGFSNSECEKLKEMMKEKLENIERECYSIAHRTFSITSPDEVARVLFVDLALPPNGIMEENTITRKTRTKAGAKTKRFSTNKAVLEKLQKIHRLPKLILEWRRVNSALTKVVYPLQRQKVAVLPLEMERVYSEAHYHTSTGRVIFSEPNLQNVPRTFDIKIPELIAESPPVESRRKRGVSGLTSTLRSTSHVPPVDCKNPVSPGEVFPINMRSIFIPFESAMFISADYSQLELRLIAHLSADEKLIKVLNSAEDVFRGIAAEVNHISLERVNDFQRQHAKQICYGIIYGMGTKSLAEELEVSEEDASVYMEEFKDRYSGVRHYIRQTVEATRKNGYVTTLAGRRRYLPAINSANSYAKSQGERQAVNTAVQGSAADLVKKAMNSITTKLMKAFGHTCLYRGKRCCSQRGGFLVLQLHDELLYEVSVKEVKLATEIIRFEMENALKLLVKIPVKVKVGSSWGCLKEV